MAKVYPENIKKDDEMYRLLRSVVCSLFLCVCLCIGLLVIIALSVEKNVDGSE